MTPNIINAKVKLSICLLSLQMLTIERILMHSRYKGYIKIYDMVIYVLYFEIAYLY